MMVGAKPVGSVMIRISELVGGKQTFELSQGGAPKGTITFKNFTMIEVPSFVDILRSGYQLSMAVAIDFTASNGEPSDFNSLHRLGAGA